MWTLFSLGSSKGHAGRGRVNSLRGAQNTAAETSPMENQQQPGRAVEGECFSRARTDVLHLCSWEIKQ